MLHVVEQDFIWLNLTLFVFFDLVGFLYTYVYKMRKYYRHKMIKSKSKSL